VEGRGFSRAKKGFLRMGFSPGAAAEAEFVRRFSPG